MDAVSDVAGVIGDVVGQGVEKVGDVAQATFEGTKGVVKGVPIGLSNFAKEFNKTFLPGYEENVVPFLQENIPGLKSLNNFVGDIFEYKNKAQEIGGEFIGEPIGEFGVTGGAIGGVAKSAGIGNRFLANVLGYGTAEVIAVPADEQGLLSMGIEYLSPDSPVTTAILESLKSDEDQSIFMQKLQKAPENFFVGGVVGEQLDKAVQGVGTLYKYIKNSPKLESIKQELKGGISTLGDTAREFLDKNRGGTTLGSTDIPRIVAEGTKALDEMVNRKEPGLSFSPEITDNNLRLHLERKEKLNKDNVPYPGGPKNERIVLKSTNKNLPDFAVGKITFDDWIKRTETLLDKSEIEKAKDWYKTIFGLFEKITGGDKDEMGVLAQAWLAGQQQSSPEQTLNNVMFVFEQFKKGTPYEEVQGKGLPSANKIVTDIIYGKEITGGAGQKISDFIDSGYGKNTRSIMGNNPEGGTPFVVDRHTARDVGYVDNELVNHLKRQGYNVPDNIILDVGGGGIQGTQYENASLFGHALTDHLNSINWQGKSDWTATEIQAIGWNSLVKLTGQVGQGGDVFDAITGTTRRISMEVDPGKGSPWAMEFGESYSNLSDVDKFTINKEITTSAINEVNKSEGIVLSGNVHGLGGWELFTNPSAVSQGVMSHDSAIKAGAKLGYLLNQTEVWVNTAKAMTKKPKNYGLDLFEIGSENLRNSEELISLFEKIVAKDPNGLFRGYQPITVNGNPGIRIIINYDAIKQSPISVEKAKEYILKFASKDGGLAEIIGDLNYNIETAISEVDLKILRNDWEKKPDGSDFKNYFSNQTGTATEGGTGTDIDNIREKLTSEFGEKIRNAQKSGSGEDSATSKIGGDDG